MITLSLCMIVKNEEDTLKRCLDSVKGVFDEIIITDTGSTDKTKEIAGSFTDKVYDFNWIDDFSAARNYSYEQATMDYIMWLDADDVLLPLDRIKLIELKKTLDPTVDIVMLKYNVGFDARGNVTFSYFRERISKRLGNFKWMEPVHECLQIRGKIIRSDICITHKKKHASPPGRNIAIYDRMLAENRQLSPRGLYYYARELKDNKRYAEAIQYFNLFLDSGQGWLEDNISACIDLAKCHTLREDNKNSLRALLKSFEYDTPRAEVCCQIGYHYKSLKSYDKAAVWFKLAEKLERTEDIQGFVKSDYYGYIPCIELAVCYDKLGKIKEAVYYNNKAEKYKPNDPAVIYNKRYFEKITAAKPVPFTERKPPKRLLVVAHLFPPIGGSGVQRTLKFIKYLGDFGWEPVVATVENSAYPLKDPSLLKEIPEDMEVHRFPEVRQSGKEGIEAIAGLFKKVIGDTAVFREYLEAANQSPENALSGFLAIPDYYSGWGANLVNKIANSVDMSSIDAIYTTSGPYTDHIVGYCLHTAYNIPWVADFRDEWTNNPFAGYDRAGLRYRLELELESKIVRTAGKVLVVTPTMKENYRKLFSVEPGRLEEITNGYDEEDFKDFNKTTEATAVFQLYHNGITYGLRSPGPVITAVKQLVEKKLLPADRFRLVFAWSEKDESWRKTVKDYGLENCISFLGYMSHRDSLALCTESNALLLLVGMGRQNGSSYTGKFFEYLRIGKPILALSPPGSVVDKLLTASGRGINCEYDNIEDIKKGILLLYQSWEKKEPWVPKGSFDITIYERKKLTGRLATVLDALVPGR